MRFLGIDPGTRVVGYAVIERRGSQLLPVTYGALRPAIKLDLPQRLRVIFEGLVEVISTSQPHTAAIEKVFHGKNIQSAIKIGEGRGVALLAAAQADLPIEEYAATTIKKAVVGVGSAHKTQVQHMVTMLLNLSAPPRPLDAADALAIAICHAHHHCCSHYA